MPASSFTFTADRWFIRQAVRAATPTRLRLLGWATVVLAALVILAIMSAQPWLAFVAGLGGIGCLAAARTTQQPLRELQRALDESFGRDPLAGQTVVTVSEQGLRVSNDAGTRDIAWTRIASVRRNPTIWLVRTVDGSLLPLPAREIPPDAARTFDEHAPAGEAS